MPNYWDGSRHRNLTREAHHSLTQKVRHCLSPAHVHVAHLLHRLAAYSSTDHSKFLLSWACVGLNLFEGSGVSKNNPALEADLFMAIILCLDNVRTFGV